MITRIAKICGVLLAVGIVLIAGPGGSVAIGKTATKSTISLAGQWQFQLDDKNIGITDEWFLKDLADSVKLPGSTDENKKGFSNTKTPDLDGLSRIYKYEGAAWYQYTINIPTEWVGKRVSLFLERCHWDTQVWLDGKPCGMQDSLCTPHTHELGTDITPGDHRLTIRIDNRIKYNVGPGAHSITDWTQTNWNGVVGKIELHATPKTWIKNVQAYPNIASKTVAIKVTLQGEKGLPIQLALRVNEQGNPIPVIEKQVESSSVDGEQTVQVDLPLGADVKLWDEFSPTLYDLSVDLSDGKQHQKVKTTFGMRKFGVTDKRLMLNNRKVFLRGTLECCVFPLTGYPPTDVNSWLRVFRIAKSYGLNHMRFHSWCPPEAAFVAADREGFLLQVEAPQWVGNVGQDAPRDQFIEVEILRILDTYGNHPSFAMLCMGNELSGDDTFLKKLVTLCKKTDSRRIYTSSTAWSFNDNDDYNVAMIYGLRGPGTDADFQTNEKNLSVPIVSHEVGQWLVFPNLAEIPKYTGVLRPRNFELIRKDLETNHLLDQAPAFTEASGKLSVELYKDEIETLLRTPGHGGFQLLDLHDFPGQGTALVGILDAFWDSKGFITPDAFRRFCGPTVPLIRMAKRTFTNNETFIAQVEAAHYGAKDLIGVTPKWAIRDISGHLIASGILPKCNLATGDVNQLGSISASFTKVRSSSKLIVSVSIKGASNDWDIWVYPSEITTTTPSDVVVTKSFKEALAGLDTGKKVLLLAEKPCIIDPRNGCFTTVFWSPVYFPPQRCKSLGILCDPKHPAFVDFPTDSFTNWQWYDLLEKSQMMDLNGTPADFKPVVQLIDNFASNHKLGNLIEAQVANGKLVVCSIDLWNDLEHRLPARQLLNSILNYMDSSNFKPQGRLTREQLDTFLCEPRETIMQSLGSKDVPNGQ